MPCLPPVIERQTEAADCVSTTTSLPGDPLDNSIRLPVFGLWCLPCLGALNSTTSDVLAEDFTPPIYTQYTATSQAKLSDPSQWPDRWKAAKGVVLPHSCSFLSIFIWSTELFDFRVPRPNGYFTNTYLNSCRRGSLPTNFRLLVHEGTSFYWKEALMDTSGKMWEIAIVRNKSGTPGCGK